MSIGRNPALRTGARRTRSFGFLFPINNLPDNCIDWLLPLAPNKPNFVPARFQRHFGRVKVAAGFNGEEATKTADGKKLRPWVQDYMRHTAISMYLAKHQHEG